MALTISVAGSGVSPAAAEQAGPDGAAGAQTASGDAFAGVLAGIGQPGPRAGQPGPRAGQADPKPGQPGSSGHRPAGAGEGSDPDVDTAAAELADLAALALATPVLPAAVPSSPGQPGQPPTDVPSSAPAGDPDGLAIGPAPQAAQSAQQAAARRPAQAVAAQAAAAAAKAARSAGEPADPHGPTQPLPTPAAGPVGPVPPAGPAPLAKPAEPAEPAVPAEPAKPAATATSRPASPGVPAGTPAATASDTPTTPSKPAVSHPNPAATGATPAVVTLPSTAAAVAVTSGAARATGSSTPGDPVREKAAQVSTPGATERGETAPAAPQTGSRAGHLRPEPQDPPAASGAQPAIAFAPAAGQAPDQAGILAVQQPAPGTGTGQPVRTGRDSEPAPQRPAAELPVASQVAGPVLALRARGDGSHQLIVALHPAELGPINVHVRIAGDAMTISLASSNDAAHDTLRDALPQLRSELQSAGLGAASLSLDLTSGGFAGSGAFADPRQAPAATPAARTVPAADQATVPARHRGSGSRTTSSGSSGLDRWL